MPFTLGIDVGSSALKVTVLDVDGGIVATAAAANDLHSDCPGFAEADPGQWWANLEEAVPRVLAHAGLRPGAITAISVCGMVPAVVLLNAHHRPIRRAILQNDVRAAVEIAELKSELAGLDLVALTGSALTQQSAAPTLRWLARNELAAWERTAQICGSYDWLAYTLGAEPHVERNWALESGLFSVDGEPIPAVFEAAGADAPQIWPLRDSGVPVGALSAAAADALGLAKGTLLWSAEPITSRPPTPQGWWKPATRWSSWAARVTS